MGNKHTGAMQLWPTFPSPKHLLMPYAPSGSLCRSVGGFRGFEKVFSTPFLLPPEGHKWYPFFSLPESFFPHLFSLAFVCDVVDFIHHED